MKQSTHSAHRRKLPKERTGITHKFQISGFEGYITAGLYQDGSLGEIFICMSKDGSTLSGLLKGFALSTSLALQYGVPLEVMVEKYKDTRFEPSGVTGSAEIPTATSILDYVFRWLEMKFLVTEEVVDPFEAGRPIVEKDPPAVVSENVYEQSDAYELYAARKAVLKAPFDARMEMLRIQVSKLAELVMSGRETMDSVVRSMKRTGSLAQLDAFLVDTAIHDTLNGAIPSNGSAHG